MAASRRDVAARARASTAGTGSTAARPTSSRPRSYHDNHAVAPPGTYRRRLPPERRSGRPGHPSSWATCGPSTPTSRSSSTSPPAPATRPTTPPAEWIERYRGAFDGGWDAWRDDTFARQLESGPPAARARELSPRPPWVPAWDELDSADRAHGGGPVHGVLRRVPLLHRRADRPGRSTSSTSWASSTTRWSSWCPTTAPAPRADAHGSINDVRLTNLDPAGPRELRRASTRSAARAPTTTTRGAGPWPATPRSGAGSARCTRAAWPTRASCTGRRGSGRAVAGAIRRQFAHAVDVLPTVLELAGISPARGRIDHVPADARSTAPASPTCWRRRGPSPSPSATTRSTSRCSGPGRIYHQGWKAVTFKPLGPMYDDGLDCRAPFDDDVWELYHVAEDLSEIARPGGRRARAPGRDGRALVGRGPPAPGAARSTTGCSTRSSTPSPSAPPRPPRLPLPAPSARPSPSRWRSTCATAPHTITVDATIPEGDGGADGVLLALGSVLGGWSLHVLDGRLRYVHNLYGKQRHTIGSRAASLPPGATGSASTSTKTAEHAGTGTAAVRRRGRSATGRDPAVHAARSSPAPASG